MFLLFLNGILIYWAQPSNDSPSPMDSTFLGPFIFFPANRSQSAPSHSIWVPLMLNLKEKGSEPLYLLFLWLPPCNTLGASIVFRRNCIPQTWCHTSLRVYASDILKEYRHPSHRLQYEYCNLKWCNSALTVIPAFYRRGLGKNRYFNTKTSHYSLLPWQ